MISSEFIRYHFFQYKHFAYDKNISSDGLFWFRSMKNNNNLIWLITVNRNCDDIMIMKILRTVDVDPIISLGI